MALDAGEPMQDTYGSGQVSQPPTVEGLAFAPGVPFGSGLRSAREFLGLSLQDVADHTKIRRSYLASLEDMAVDQLPSRPFAIGYVRAYARALGLDEDAAVTRFKQDAPDREEPLRAPVGVPKERDPRLTLVMIGGAIVLAAIVIWNVAQRAMRDTNAQPVAAIAAPPPQASQPPVVPGAPVVLGRPLPPPTEATVPAPYVTPGMNGVAAAAPEAPTAPRAIGLRGQAYGAPADQSTVTLQAVRSISLVVHGPSGANIFARELSKGDLYRAPNIAGLSFEVSAPDAVDVFVGGQFAGALPQPITPLSALAK